MENPQENSVGCYCLNSGITENDRGLMNMGLVRIFYTIIAKIRREVRNAYFRKKLGNLGKGSSIYPGVFISYPENIFIGDDVSIAPGVHLSASSQGRITIGDRCAIAQGTRIVTATHDPDVLPISKVGINKDVNIGQDVWIGTAAIILPGVTVHDGVIVAAGAVVTKDIQQDCMVGGVPARLIRNLETRPIRRDKRRAS